MLNELLALVIPQALLLALLGFLSRQIYLHWLNKDLERFKDQLKAQQEAQIRETQHVLDKLKLEHQVRFSALHEKRFEKIEELHDDVRIVVDALLESLRTEAATRHGRILDASQKTKALYEKLKRFELFLPGAFVDALEKELGDVSLALSNLGAATADPARPSQPDLKNAVDKIAASLRTINGRLTAQARAILEG